jgi:hypothetical protein
MLRQETSRNTITWEFALHTVRTAVLSFLDARTVSNDWNASADSTQQLHWVRPLHSGSAGSSTAMKETLLNTAVFDPVLLKQIVPVSVDGTRDTTE